MFEYAKSEIKQGFHTKRTLSLQFSPTVVQTQLTNSTSTPESYLLLSTNEANTSLNSSNHTIWDQNSGIFNRSIHFTFLFFKHLIQIFTLVSYYMFRRSSTVFIFNFLFTY